MSAIARVQATSGSGGEPRYRPINEYGIIGDCRTAALVGPDGSIDWCCMPHFDSPAILCRLLDDKQGGYLRIRPNEVAESEMSYLPGTNILETLFSTASGRLRLVDFMPIRKRTERLPVLDHLGDLFGLGRHRLAAGYERALGNDVAAAHRINRMVNCLEGAVTVEVELKATFDYARKQASIEWHRLGDSAAAAILSDDQRYLVLVVRRRHTLVRSAEETPVVLEGDDHLIRARLSLKGGQGFIVGLNYARTAEEAHAILEELAQHDFDRDLGETRAYWRDWSAVCKYDGTYQSAVIRSALTLKLCTFEPTGAIIAAPTTSLPETIGGVRNWDYRYTWLRDSAFTLAALERLGYYDEARDYFHFIHDLQIKSGADIRIMYGIRGETGDLLEEHSLDHLAGYRESRPVRVGNGAATQRQLDIYGELLDSAYSYLHHEGYERQYEHTPEHGRLSGKRDLRGLCSLIGEYVIEHWRDNDRGIWEVRGEPRPFVYSRAMCWVALDRLVKMARRHFHDDDVERWTHARDTIHADILAHGYSETLHSFVQSYGSEVFDAANLRLPIVRFLPWDDPRIVSTISATEYALSAPDALIYRYRAVDDSTEVGGALPGNTAVDGLPGKEGTFLACALWLIDDLCYLGRIEEARVRLEQILRLSGPLGLFAEEIDPDTGAQLGNYPQAFTHIGLINCAVTLQRAQEGTLDAHPDAPTSK
jgi:GH15 family glucan-1,4-alpha-glucosidase